MSPDVDVLVAGAGPVGSMLAADLVRRGVRVRLVDRAPEAFAGSRAKGVQPRTLELLDDLGVVDRALAEGGEYPLMGAHLGPLTVPWRMQRRRRPSPDVPYPNVLLLPQSRTDAILHGHLASLGGSVEFGTGVDGFDQDNEGVSVALQTAERVRCRYLVGADGGASTVRKLAGLRFAGTTDESDRMLIADATVAGLSRNRWHVWPRAGGRFVAACPLPHGEQFQLMVRLAPEDEPDPSEGALAERFRSLTGLSISGVTWSSLFRPNVRIVERYRAGRVFLAGDAAHVHTPAGAQGLNTGVQDAYNLGWKLAQAIAGAPDALLDTYDGERRPVAARVLGRSSELYAGLDERRLSSLFRGDEERQIKLSYHGGPLAPENGPRTAALRVGDRAPDAPCRGVGIARLFDAYRGPHFTALAFGPGAPEALAALSWPAAGAALRRFAVRPRGDMGGEGTLVDEQGLVARAYRACDDELLLIRPDGYVASVGKPDLGLLAPS
ncbi:MAG TPA: FAD-dependent monooxygenase [Solirubrobacteraceae bacterium]|nr:FAD-dependent monooxygenase [Solirubrobacteraceae bacterium]